MKIAILHTGQPRTYKRCLPNWKKAYAQYDVDVFVGAYDMDGTRLDGIKDTARQFGTQYISTESPTALLDTSAVDMNEFSQNIHEWLSPKELIVLSWSATNETIINDMKSCNAFVNVGCGHLGAWAKLPTTMWHQFYIVRELFSTINISDYDLIVRARLDAAWVGMPEFEPIDSIHYPPYREHLPHDYLAYGPPHLMREVCSIYEKLPHYWKTRGHTQAGHEAHITFSRLYSELPSSPSMKNKMSIIRTSSYPKRYDTSFLLEKHHALRWSDPGVNHRDQYDPDENH